MPTTYHDFDPWRQAAQNISAGLIAAQQARARQAMHQQEMEMQRPLIEARTDAERAQGRHYDAQTKKSDAETARLIAKGEAMERIQKGAGVAFNDLQSGLQTSPAIESLIGDLSIVEDDNPDNVRKMIVGFASGGKAAKGDARLSALFANPESVYKTEQDNTTRQRLGEMKDNTTWQLGQDKLDTTFDLGLRNIASREKIASQAQGNKVSAAEAARVRGLEADILDIKKTMRLTNPGSRAYLSLQKELVAAIAERGVPQNPLTPPPASGNSGATPAAGSAKERADALIAAFNSTPISDPAKKAAASKKLELMLQQLGYSLNTTNAPAK